PDAGSSHARVGPRTGVAVVARRAVRLRRIRADAGHGVAGAGAVALVECGADDRIASAARAVLTGVGPRTGVAVAARGAVRRVGIRARSGGRAARPRRVTLI